MNLVIALIVMLFAFAAGTVSYILLPRIKEETTLVEDTENSETRGCKSTADNSFSAVLLLKNLSWRRWALIAFGTIFCGFAGYLLASDGMEALKLCRHLVCALTLFSVMIIDWHTHLIPNKLVLLFFCVETVLLIAEFVTERSEFAKTAIQCGIGLLGGLIVFYVLSRLTKAGISMGDVKIIAAAGWAIGIQEMLYTLLFSMLICALVAIFLLVCKKKKKNDRIPFGPFMFLGYMALISIFSL